MLDMKSGVINNTYTPFSIRIRKKHMQMLGEGFIFKVLLYCLFLSTLAVNASNAIIIDRLAAYVDDTAITLSEFDIEFQKMSKATPNISKKEVMDSIINRILLIKEARKIKLDANTEDELINLYLDIKIRSRLFVKDEEIVNFYKEYIGEFKGQDYLLVKDQIENYLLQKEFNDILKKHIEELRQNAEIRVFIIDK